MRQVLKYPGSKWKIAGQLAALIPPHRSYVEPFFGSGALLFRKSFSAIETINDLDHDVVNLFSCIQEDAGRLSRLIMTTLFSREVYDNAFGYEDSVTEAIREDPYQKALVFLIKCWQGHGFRTNGYKVGWKNDVQGICPLELVPPAGMGHGHSRPAAEGTDRKPAGSGSYRTI